MVAILDFQLDFQEGRHLRFPFGKILVIFDQHPNASYQVSSQLAFRFRRRSEKYIFKMAAKAANMDLQSERV